MSIYAVLNDQNICTGYKSKGNPETDIVFSSVGLLWDGTEWQPAPVKVVPEVRVITKRSFMQRIKQADRILIRASIDPIVKDIHEDLLIASSVDLDDAETGKAIDYLSASNLLLSTDRVKLLEDGSQKEKYS